MNNSVNVIKGPFNYNAAFSEIGEAVYGVWVGEHGFLVAVFIQEDAARAFAEENYSKEDFGIGKIELQGEQKMALSPYEKRAADLLGVWYALGQMDNEHNHKPAYKRLLRDTSRCLDNMEKAR